MINTTEDYIMAVRTEEIPVRFSGVILKKVPTDKISQTTGFGKLYVVFIDEGTNTFKLAIPTYYNVKTIDENNISQMDSLKNATYRCSFENITDKIQWNNIEDDMFALVIDPKTRKVIRMTQLTDFNADCINYFYQHLDPEDCQYPNTESKLRRYYL